MEPTPPSYPPQGGYPPPGPGQQGFPAYPGGRNELVPPGSGGTSSVAVVGFSFSLVGDIGVQPCDQPNGGKVFAVFDLPAGDWPGLADVQAAAEKGCTDRFKATKLKPEKPSDIMFLHPVENGWALGDRGTTCLLTPQ